MTKVIVRIWGGLGNQLFSYAAARRLALVNNSELVIDDISGFCRDYDYQRHYQLDNFNIPFRKASPAERLQPFGRYRSWLKRKLSAFRPFDKRHYLTQEGMDYDPRLLEIKVKGTLYISGYWQSESYFKDIESIIRKDLEITGLVDGYNDAISKQIKFCNSVAVHVRWFHAPGSISVNNLAVDYYQRAIKLMEQSVPDAHYFLFSDNPSAALKHINIPADRLTCISHNKGDKIAYMDLWLMAQCKNFIIANSTFSWWGAWLGSSVENVIIAPGYELREGVAWWGFNGLIPERWIKI